MLLPRNTRPSFGNHRPFQLPSSSRMCPFPVVACQLSRPIPPIPGADGPGRSSQGYSEASTHLILSFVPPSCRCLQLSRLMPPIPGGDISTNPFGEHHSLWGAVQTLQIAIHSAVFGNSSSWQPYSCAKGQLRPLRVSDASRASTHPFHWVTMPGTTLVRKLYYKHCNWWLPKGRPTDVGVFCGQ